MVHIKKIFKKKKRIRDKCDYYVQNSQQGPNCIAQGTILNVL